MFEPEVDCGDEAVVNVVLTSELEVDTLEETDVDLLTALLVDDSTKTPPAEVEVLTLEVEDFDGEGSDDEEPDEPEPVPPADPPETLMLCHDPLISPYEYSVPLE